MYSNLILDRKTTVFVQLGWITEDQKKQLYKVFLKQVVKVWELIEHVKHLIFFFVFEFDVCYPTIRIGLAYFYLFPNFNDVF